MAAPFVRWKPLENLYKAQKLFGHGPGRHSAAEEHSLPKMKVGRAPYLRQSELKLAHKYNNCHYNTILSCVAFSNILRISSL